MISAFDTARFTPPPPRPQYINAICYACAGRGRVRAVGTATTVEPCAQCAGSGHIVIERSE